MTTKILKKSDTDAAPVGQQIAALLAGLSSAELDALGTAVRARADSVYVSGAAAQSFDYTHRSQVLSNLALGFVVAPAPSGDTTGATDSAAVSACLNALGRASGLTYPTGGTPVRVLFREGTYYFNAALPIVPPGMSLEMPPGAVTFKFVGSFAGPCLRSADVNFNQAGGRTQGESSVGARIGPLKVDATGWTGTGACVQLGDVTNSDFDLLVIGGNNAGQVGLWFNNQYGWFEKNHVRAWVHNFAQEYVFDCSTGGPGGTQGTLNSFEYNDFDLRVRAWQSQDGVVFQNGAAVVNCGMKVRGNFNSSVNSGNTGTVWKFVAASGGGTTQFIGRLDLQVEANGSGTQGPVTMDIPATGAKFAANGSVNYRQFAGQPSFQTATFSPGRDTMGFTGYLNVDSVIGLMADGQAQGNYGQVARNAGFWQISGTSISVFWKSGNAFNNVRVGALTANTAYAFHLNPTGQNQLLGQFGVAEFEVAFQQPADVSTGAATITSWLSDSYSLAWDTGVAPQLTPIANFVDRFRFISYDGGVSWMGQRVGNHQRSSVMVPLVDTPTSIDQGTWSYSTSSSAPFGHRLASSGAVNDAARWAVDLSAGLYSLDLYTLQNTTGAGAVTVDISFDNGSTWTTITTSLVCYAASATAQRTQYTGIKVPSTGKALLRMKAVTVGTGAGYTVFASAASFRRTA